MFSTQTLTGVSYFVVRHRSFPRCRGLVHSILHSRVWLTQTPPLALSPTASSPSFSDGELLPILAFPYWF